MSPVAFWMVKRQWKETCFRKGISVYFVANPTGCQVHNPVTILFPISIKKALPISGQGQQPVSPKLLLCFLSPLMANIAEMFSFYWQFSFPFVVFLFVWIRFRYQCTRNDHHSSAPRYGRTVDANPTKVYIFWKLNNCRFRGFIYQRRKKLRFVK